MDSDTDFDVDVSVDMMMMMENDMVGMAAPGDELVGMMPTSVNRRVNGTMSEDSKQEVQEYSSRREVREATTSFGKGTRFEDSYNSNAAANVSGNISGHDSRRSNDTTASIAREHRPGAFAVPTRAQGALPAWHRRVSAHLVAPFQRSSASSGSRRQRRSRARNSSSSAGSIIGRISIFGFNRQSQANIPPEMRTARVSILDAMFGSPSQNSSRHSGQRDFVTADCSPATIVEGTKMDDEDDDFVGDTRVGLVILCLICALFGVAAAGLVLILGDFDDDGEDGNNGIPAPNTSPPSPSPSMNNEPRTEVLNISDRQKNLQSKLAYLSSDGEDVFIDDESPQFLAVQWLADGDPAQVNESDQERLETRYALATFYYEMKRIPFGGNGWGNDDCGFVSELHECFWNCNISGVPGVVCDENLQITDIIFDERKRLTGDIPEEIAGLPSTIQFIRISSSSLSNVENFGSISSLTTLELPLNQIDAVLPEMFGRLTKLERLIVRQNLFRLGLSDNYSDLKSLRYFDVSNNRLSGYALEGLSELSNLEVLLLDKNRGMFLKEDHHLRQLTNLKRLGLEQIKHDIPLEDDVFIQLSDLEHLDLRRGTLRGTIPSTIGGLSNLRWLYLSANTLDGTFPWNSFWEGRVIVNGVTSTIEEIEVSNNFITGMIPNDIHNLQTLKRLDVGANLIEGTIPTSIGELTCMEELNLARNNLNDATIPTEMGNLSSLTSLDLSFNGLIGDIPIHLANISSLAYIDLRGNNLIDENGSLEYFCQVHVNKTTSAATAATATATTIISQIGEDNDTPMTSLELYVDDTLKLHCSCCK